MLESHLISVGELTPQQLCTYIEAKQYTPIRQSLKTLSGYAADLESEPDASGPFQLLGLLFYKLKDEIDQMIRKDEIIIFPMIRLERKAGESNPSLPVKFIKDINKRILNLQEKVRQLANNYLFNPSWSHNTKLFLEELFVLEQLTQQAIYLKENVLLRKLNDLDNSAALAEEKS